MYLVFIPKFPLLILLICFVHPLHLCSLYHRQPYHPVILHALPSSFRFLLRPPSSYFLFILCDFSLVWPSPSFIHSMSSTPSYPPSSLLPILPSSSPSPSFHSSSSFTLCHLLPSPSLVRVLVVRRDRPGGIDLTERFVLT